MTAHAPSQGSASSDALATPRRWGSFGRLSFWFNSLLIAPLASFLAALVGGVLGFCLGLLLVSLFGLLAYEVTLSGRHHDKLLALGAGSGVVTGLSLLGAWWHYQAPCTLWTDHEKIVRWGLTGRKTIRWDDVVHAFITLPTHTYEPHTKQVLHLWTRWRELTIPIHHVCDSAAPAAERLEAFDAFVDHVAQHLHAHGKHIEREVPVTPITHAASPLRYAAHWPQRRILAQRFHRLDTATTQPVDHHKPVPSMALGWLFRPAPFATLAAIGGFLALVRWNTTAPTGGSLLVWSALLAAAVVPLWNVAKEMLLKLRSPNAWMPEWFIGLHTLDQPLPDRLLPAPSCVVDLNRRVLQRPDRRAFAFDQIQAVEYGPAKRLDPHAPAPTHITPSAWHLAVYTREGGAAKPHEIFGNASADIVRHGDLDSGYAVFNWVAAREIALRAKANLLLANGRVAHNNVGVPLCTRLASDITQYDPEPIAEALERSGERSRVHIRHDGERFDVWGPLVRQPEHCAVPPIFKPLLALVCAAVAALLPVSATVAAPIAAIVGYALITSAHDLLTYLHFRAPGFTMDHTGVWVRGVCVSWEALEESSLMPVAPGPILFAGPRTVLIAGHLGSSYNERALLGCSAYQWIRAHIGEDPEQAATPPRHIG